MHINSTPAKIILALFLNAVNIPLMAQDYKVIKEIKNVFEDRKEEWKADNKFRSDKVKLSGDKLVVNNSKNDMPYNLMQPTNKKYEQECWEYTNGKFSVLARSLLDDNTRYCGLGIERRNDLSTNTSTFKKKTNGPKDALYRTFNFLINAKGEIKIVKVNMKDHSEQVLFQLSANKAFLNNAPNLLTIERKGLNWNFYLNNESVFTHKDNSFGDIANINFITDATSKASFETPSFIYYDNEFLPYEQITTGITTYKDNECRFKILEGNIEKQCPTAEQNTEHARYLSGMCYKEDGLLQFGILFYRSGEKTSNPLSEFLDKYAKELYGEKYDEATFNTKKVNYTKKNEGSIVKQLKENFTNQKKDAANVKFSDLYDLQVGNNIGRYFDIKFDDANGASVRRLFYTYTPNGLMVIQFDGSAGNLNGNKIYEQIIKNIYSF